MSRAATAGRGWLLLLLLVGAFFGPFGGNMILPMFGVLKQWFQVDILLLSLSITTFMIPFSITQLFSGLLSDILYGRRAVVAAGFAVYGLGALAAALSPTIWFFLASRALQGVGAALVTPVLMAMVGDVFGRSVRGKVMGGMAVSTTLGTTLGPLLGGYLAAVDWRLGFFTVFLIASAMVATSLQVLPKGPSARRGGKPFKILWRVAANVKVMVVGLLGFILFYSRMSFYTYLSDTLTLEPYHLEEEFIGSLLALAGVGGLVAGPIAGYLVDALGRATIAAAGLSASAAILALYSLPSWFELLPVLLFLVGFSVTCAFTSLNTIAVEVEAKYRATATSLYGFIRFLGYAAAPIISYPLYVSGALSLVIAVSAASLGLGAAMVLIFLGRD